VESTDRIQHVTSTDREFLQLIWGMVYLYTGGKPQSTTLLRLNRMIEALPEVKKISPVRYWIPRIKNVTREKGIKKLSRMFNQP